MTICIQGRVPLLGEVVDGEMQPNAAGDMVWHWWDELAHKFSGVEPHLAVVMPNHFHGIVIICADDDPSRGGNSARSPRPVPTLGDIVGWFKTMTTNAYMRGVRDRGWPPFDRRLWQRNYWERVIRNDREMWAIQEYIENNPAQWEQDRLNPVNPWRPSA